jgi:hypothetical protein
LRCQWSQQEGCFDPGDGDDGGSNQEGCAGLSQDECAASLDCEWMSNDIAGNLGFCVEVGGMDDGGDDSGWDDCDPDLACAQVLTCFDGFFYPTSCGPLNCDLPLYPCEEDDWYCEDINNLYECYAMGCEWVGGDMPGAGYCIEDSDEDGPPECLEDCEGIEDVSPSENPYEACDWIISNLGFDSGFASCTQDCDDETLMEINEIIEACFNCLSEQSKFVSDKQLKQASIISLISIIVSSSQSCVQLANPESKPRFEIIQSHASYGFSLGLTSSIPSQSSRHSGGPSSSLSSIQ